MITAIAVFLAGEGVMTQTVVAQVVIVIFIAAHFRMKPYEQTALDRLEMGALLVAFATLTGGLMLEMRSSAKENLTISKESQESRKTALTITVIALNCVYLIFWCRYFWLATKERVRAAKEKVKSGVRKAREKLSRKKGRLQQSSIEMTEEISTVPNPMLSARAMEELRQQVAEEMVQNQQTIEIDSSDSDDWEEGYDSDGRGYLWNSRTGESKWMDEC